MKSPVFLTQSGGAPVAKTRDGSSRAVNPLRISEPNDASELEADRMADEVMGGGLTTRHWSLSQVHGDTSIQRKCACGGTPGPDGECAACKQKRLLQRKATGAPAANAVHPVIPGALNSPGRPLDRATRHFMETRFGHDFGQVRIHTDASAAESARNVNAMAYAVGKDISFAAGQYSPHSPAGQRLLAHELAHVVQQEKATDLTLISRKPCLDSDICKNPIPGSSWDFANKEATVQQSKAKALGTAKAKPRPSVELLKFTQATAPELVKKLGGILVNPTITNAGAQLGDCSGMKPAPPAGVVGCMEVPESLQQEAATHNNTNDEKVGKLTRKGWELTTIETLTHEVAHGVFNQKPPAELGGSDQVTLFELSEFNSILSEYPVRYRGVMASPRTENEKKDKIRLFIERQVNNGEEGIRGILTKIRCRNSCEQVNKLVRAVFYAQAANWTPEERTFLLFQLTQLMSDWPIPVPDPDIQPPPPERPKFGPLYHPRGDFNQQILNSSQNL